jgi:group I intron endonuclease
MSTHTYTQTKKAVIYIHINLCSPTLKSYVGYTTNFKKRITEHLYAALCGKPGHFYNAIRKDGWNNFHSEILDQSDDIKHTRDILEPYYIKLCKSFTDENGYNLTFGGEGLLGCSEETKQKLRNFNRGNHHSEKTKRQMSKSHRKSWILQTPRGIIQTSNLKQFCKEHDLKYHTILSPTHQNSKSKCLYKILKRID